MGVHDPRRDPECPVLENRELGSGKERILRRCAVQGGGSACRHSWVEPTSMVTQVGSGESAPVPWPTCSVETLQKVTSGEGLHLLPLTIRDLDRDSQMGSKPPMYLP